MISKEWATQQPSPTGEEARKGGFKGVN